MSGHSKWSKVKHQKATTDAVKGREFTKASHTITIAVRQGGGVTDPVRNFRLRLAMEKARMVNMPKENIARAIEKGLGTGAEHIEEMVYEGYGPGGAAFLIHAATDNRQRTVSEVKNILERAGGTLAGPGSVAYLFERVVENREVFFRPTMTIPLDEVTMKSITHLVDALELLDDVQTVYTNASA